MQPVNRKFIDCVSGADAVTRRALEIVAEEERKIAAIEAGHLIPDWVDPKLKELGYELD